MNNIAYFGRNNFPMMQGNSNFLTSSSSNNQKYRENMNYSQEVTSKKNQNIIIKNKNDNNIKKTPKYENNINLLIDCKKDLKKNPKIINYDLNYKKNYSYFEKNDKFNYLNSKINILETEPNKINNNELYSKLNQPKNKNIYNEIFSNNKPSYHILSTYYNNKERLNKNSIKKKKNYNINFNYNSPKTNNNIKYNINSNAKNMNSKNNIINSNNSKNKYQSFTNINKIINKDFPHFPELLKEKRNLTKIKSEISIKNKKRNENQNNLETNNIYLRRPLTSFSSDIYLKTENNINIRNNSYNNKINTNYNLLNIVSPKERKNTFTNINSMGKEAKFNYQNYLNLVSSNNKSNNNSFKKAKDNYSFNQNDIKFDKICLNKFYEETFNDSNNDKKLNIKNNKFENTDDIIYKDNLTTNQSTYTNGSYKIKNLKKSFSTFNQNNKYGNEKIENFEELHYFIVSYIQNGKKAEKKFN